MDENKNLLARPVRFSAVDYYPYEIFPHDLNPSNTVFGGVVLRVADHIAGVVAQKHTRKVCVTLLVDSVRFLAPARQGETLNFKTAVNRVWNTSLEIGVKVIAENYQTDEVRHVLSAYFTFVAIDESGRPTAICPVIPETEEEKRRFNEAENRRQLRLQNRGLDG